MQQEPGRVPELVGEVAADLEPLGRLLRGRQLRVVGRPRPAGAERLLALRAGRASCVRMYMCSCFTGTSVPQCGHTFATGMRLSCVSVASVHHAEAQGVGAVEVDDVERVDAVALRLGHRLAEAVEHLRVDVDVVERHLAEVVQPGDHHPRHPERDDVAARHQHAGRVVVAPAPASAPASRASSAARARS